MVELLVVTVFIEPTAVTAVADVPVAVVLIVIVVMTEEVAWLRDDSAGPALHAGEFVQPDCSDEEQSGWRADDDEEEYIGGFKALELHSDEHAVIAAEDVVRGGGGGGGSDGIGPLISANGSAEFPSQASDDLTSPSLLVTLMLDLCRFASP